ncbi:hypothetical protein ACH5RR_035042 [Cinchona calisaya]|uniref:Uncharacterized protein n=1 Tax=Cinchona calisaya TaxID=153742 RepID=A0ABD2YE06_9GENT
MGRTGLVLSELSVHGQNPRIKCEEDYEETSIFLESQETESKSTQWTDQKHSMYLTSTEASFVKELCNSFSTLDGCSHQEYTSESKFSRQNLNGFPTHSGQFKVFKDGYWARVNFSNFGREMPRPKKADKSNHIFANPWIQHYMSSHRHQNRISPTLQGQDSLSTVADLSAFQFGCQDSIGSNAEVTDQNFVDEVSEEDKSIKQQTSLNI